MYSKRALKMGKSGKAGRRLFWQKKNTDEEGTAKESLHSTENGNVAGHAENSGEFVPRDGGWGWVVCFTALWANGTVFGIINTFGIVYIQMREHYSKNDPEVSLKTAFVGSTCTGVTFLMCTISSIMSDRIGIRPTAFAGAVLATAGLVASAFIQRLELLYLTFGIMLGLGSSMAYSPSLVILGHYFKKHIGLVNGIVAFGSSLFTIGLTRILPFLLANIGIKYCFLFLAGLQFILIIFTLSWKPVFKKEDHLAALTLSTESIYEHCNDCCSWTKKFLNVKIWRRKAYVIWVLSLGIALFGYFVPFFHLPKYIADNFPGQDGSLPILCLSITSGVGRIICGKVADLPWVSRIKMQQLAFVILGVSTVCIPFSKSFGGIIVISLVMGICDGIFVCLLGPIAFDIVGPAEASQAIGFLLGIFSIPFTIGPPIAGWMYDSMGDYRVAFHVTGIPPILGALVMFLIPKVEQSYPAVTETQEFASISMIDVYNEVRVPKHNQPQQSKSKHSNPSGPSTELEFIQSNEILYLGTSRGNSIDSPPMSADNNCSNPSENNKDETVDNQLEDEHTEKSPFLGVNNNEIGCHKDDEIDSIKQISNGTGRVETEENERDIKHDSLELPNGMESSSLLEEVGKYFETNKLSYESEKT